MIENHLLKKAEQYLHKFCVEISGRCVGSDGNRAATKFFRDTISLFNFDVEYPEFDCMDWSEDGAKLSVGDQSFEVFVSPYSNRCDVQAPLCVASTVEELKTIDATDKIILLHGEIAKEQLMPKNFPFYNPKEHQEIIQLLESKKPKAIISATTRNPELAGGVYPFPLIEDGDFDIPSVFITDDEGKKLVKFEGKFVSLKSIATRKAAKGHNVIARKGKESNNKFFFCAHIDGKMGTPAAIDNATGAIVLLLLAELLKDYSNKYQIEIVPFNGEDYYSSPGQIQYLAQNKDTLSEILLAINLDGVGYKKGKTAFSTYECPQEFDEIITNVFSKEDELIEGEPWYQGDHSIFIQNQIPAMAITTEHFIEISTYISHTPKDNPEIVDCEKLVKIANALFAFIVEFDKKIKA